ncbi:hypothetical protein [Candidatus Symbiopectobacterium sp. NZEC135]|uniref:hypothetical protein n=1 Tax=Candidatus Symbiopectobacterium sp. NZEC135 TaxID=2820471 RepID=UPI0022274023|nr:hypothetical protein [Candidatus Symbiopectobacterium sp. NZEC135]MCW2479734.1 hypothetical protein [Candidatus Symbiopectobacterium sp. NZEC135]
MEQPGWNYCFLLGVIMPWGAVITRDDGSLWLSPDFTPLNFIEKGIIVANGDAFVTSIPTSKNVIFFINQSADNYVACQQIEVDGYHALRVNSSYPGTLPIRVYCFANMALQPKANYGLYFYNASGELTYSLDMLPLDMRTVAVDISAAGVKQDMGRPVAVIPTASGRVMLPNSSVGGFDVWDLHLGATGNYVINRPRLIAQGQSGANNYIYIDRAFYIFTDVYD